MAGRRRPREVRWAREPLPDGLLQCHWEFSVLLSQQLMSLRITLEGGTAATTLDSFPCTTTSEVPVGRMPPPTWRKCSFVNHLQGVPSARGLGWVDWNFECSTVPNSAWADGNLTKAAGQDGGIPPSKSTQVPNPGPRAGGTSCRCCRLIRETCPGSAELVRMGGCAGGGGGAACPRPADMTTWLAPAAPNAAKKAPVSSISAPSDSVGSGTTETLRKGNCRFTLLSVPPPLLRMMFLSASLRYSSSCTISSAREYVSRLQNVRFCPFYFYLRRSQAGLTELRFSFSSSVKFKSGVSVKLQSSHNEFQEAMSSKISILRLALI